MEFTRSQILRGGLGAALSLWPLRAAGAAGPPSGGRPTSRGSGGPLRLSHRVVELHLRHAWTLSRGTTRTKRNVIVTLDCDGITGLGEAAPNIRYGETTETVLQALAAAGPLLAGIHPSHLAEAHRRLREALPAAHAARCAIDMALWDWNGRALGIPLWRQLGLDPGAAPLTSFSLAISDRQELLQKVQEAAPYPLLKLKLGARGPFGDREIVQTVREAAPHKRLRVDPNEGWTPAEARQHLRWLAGLRHQGAPVVELCEQPLPAHDLPALQALYRERLGVPILLDESALSAEEVPRLVGSCDGIVVKLQKAGGLTGALQQIAVARALGMRVMLGCMIESSLGITAAAHLAPLCDHADLDGHLLVDNDPFVGVKVAQGRLHLPQGPGLGVQTT
ncbi:MAG: dipeptide epimerase [Myxococcales bacterium]|nr:dipeptide epimerase [Myxococcota bacterium]MDW8280433.1 dipeptide epimerase [Myxococcales bacterium]